MSGIDSFIGWVGGKTKLRQTIINCFPEHQTYIEVFAGSACVFFGKPPEISKIEIINDINGDLVNLMKVISGTYFDESIRQEFISYVRNMPASRSAFEEWKHWDLDKLDNLSPAQKAFVFYFCVKKGFSCCPTGGFESSPLTRSRYNMNSDFESVCSRFRAKNAQIESMDFRKLIEKYSNPRASSFFFADPPYFVANKTNYYKFVFTEKDHNDFKTCCDLIHKNNNKFLITYDDTSKVIDLYKDYFIYRTDILTYSANEREIESDNFKTELFITNYSLLKNLNNKSSKQDIFSNVVLTDKRIEFDGAIGLEQIHVPV